LVEGKGNYPQIAELFSLLKKHDRFWLDIIWLPFFYVIQIHFDLPYSETNPSSPSHAISVEVTDVRNVSVVEIKLSKALDVNATVLQRLRQIKAKRGLFLNKRFSSGKVWL
jgi:hypothetical protein